MVKGYSSTEVKVALSKRWNVGFHSVRRYIQHAHDELAKSNELIRGAELIKAIRRFHAIYKKAMHENDPKTALSAASKVCEVLKLGELGKLDINLTGNLEHEHSIDAEQAETIFNILEKTGALEAFSSPAETE